MKAVNAERPLVEECSRFERLQYRKPPALPGHGYSIGTLIMVDDGRMRPKRGEVPMMHKVHFRTLGCYPLAGAVESEADTLPAIIQDMQLISASERRAA